MYISKEKKEKISEQILAHLYLNNPKPTFYISYCQGNCQGRRVCKKTTERVKEERTCS